MFKRIFLTLAFLAAFSTVGLGLSSSANAWRYWGRPYGAYYYGPPRVAYYGGYAPYRAYYAPYYAPYYGPRVYTAGYPYDYYYGYGYPYYGAYYAPVTYGGDCWIERRVHINRWGERIVRRVQICS